MAAVSGGVDSMVLLDMLRRYPGLQLVVAHFDHGIRPDSGEDRQLVQRVAKSYGLPFVYNEGRLGPKASEEVAREARYAFLGTVRRAAGAKAIITAHHEDDVLETAILNIMRGTGRRGLTSLGSSPGLMRPLLPYTKHEIRVYARGHELIWREDSTNADDRYIRNYIRHHVLPQFTPAARAELRGIIGNARHVNDELDAALAGLMHVQPATHELDRAWFALLPHGVAIEFLAAWLRARGLAAFDRDALERIVVAAKTQRAGTTIDIMQGASLKTGKYTLALTIRER